jgi:DNA-binding NtrC family response regulator
MNIDWHSKQRLRSLRFNVNGGIVSLQQALDYAFEMGYRKKHYDQAFAPVRIKYPTFVPVPMVKSNNLTDIERVAIHHVLTTVAKGNKGRAARMLGMSQTTLCRKLREHNVKTV